MNINIRTTSFSLTPSISEYAEKRLGPIGKFFQYDSTTKCDLELSRTTSHHKHGDVFRAEIHIIAKDKNLYASAEEGDLYVAIDALKDEIFREIKTSNEKHRSLIRRGGTQVKNILKGFWPGKRK